MRGHEEALTEGDVELLLQLLDLHVGAALADAAQLGELRRAHAELVGVEGEGVARAVSRRHDAVDHVLERLALVAKGDARAHEGARSTLLLVLLEVQARDEVVASVGVKLP